MGSKLFKNFGFGIQVELNTDYPNKKLKKKDFENTWYLKINKCNCKLTFSDVLFEIGHQRCLLADALVSEIQLILAV
jgi:hypothetical protein